MKQKITLTKEALDVFKSLATIVVTNESEYMYFPFWLKGTSNELDFELLNLDSIPKELYDAIIDHRNSSDVGLTNKEK